MRLPAWTAEDAVASATSHSRAVWLVALGEVVLSLALGFYHLGHKSLWFDEGYSAIASSGGWARASSDTAAGGNMSGYHLLLSAWRRFGDGEFSLRSLSVIAAAAAVFVVFLLGSKLFGSRVGLISGFLLAISPFTVHYAQEARSYALLLLLVTLASYFFLLGIEQRRWRWWALYTVTAASACYAHDFAALVIMAQVASLVLLPRPAIPMRQLALAGATLALLVIPFASLLASSDNDAASSRPTARAVAQVVTQIAGGKMLAVILFGLCVLLLIVWSRTLRVRDRSFETWRLGFVVMWLIVPVLVALTYSLLIRPTWQYRYFIVVLPALVIAAAFGIARLRDRKVASVLLALVTVLAAFNVVHVYETPAQQDWRQVVNYISAAGSSTDGIVFCAPSARPPFEYYALRHPSSSRPDPLSPSAPWSAYLHQNETRSTAVAAWRHTPQRIWVVSPYRQFPPYGGCDLQKSMEGRKETVSTEIGHVLVKRFDPV